MEIDAHVDPAMGGQLEQRFEHPRSFGAPWAEELDAYDERPPDQVIADLATRQHGVVSRRQLRSEAGLTPRAIEHRLGNGRLHVVHRSVYAVGHRQLSQRGRWMAATLFAGIDGTLSHRSAAALWDLRPYGGRDEVIARTHRRSTARVTVRCRRLAYGETTVRHGIQVSTAARTVFDLAAVVEPEEVARAIEKLEVRRLLGPVPLATLLERYPGRAGAGAIRKGLRAVGGTTIPTRSELEDRFLSLLERHGLPRPLVNYPITTRRTTFECDCAWLDACLVVELDGYAFHAERTAYEEDRMRDRALEVAGWRVIRLTWAQLASEEAEIATDLEALLGR